MARHLSLPYPPPYQDIATLAEHISLSPHTIDAWVKMGRLPPPKVRDGKRLWKWTEVVRYLDGEAAGVPSSPDETAERIRNATRTAASQRN